jgi:hypothetical protein
MPSLVQISLSVLELYGNKHINPQFQRYIYGINTFWTLSIVPISIKNTWTMDNVQKVFIITIYTRHKHSDLNLYVELIRRASALKG